MILSRSGGEALVSAYAARQWGFQLPPLSPPLTALLKERSRAGIIKPNNPIDLGDIFDFTVYSDLMAWFCADAEVDAILFNYGPVADFEMEPARRMARHLVEQARKAGKPLAVCVLCTLNEEEFFRETLGVPVFHFPEDAVQALASSREWGGREALGATTAPGCGSLDQVSAILTQAPAGFLPLPQALALTAALGIPAAPWEAVDNPEAAAAAAGRLGYPVVLKLSAASLIHKTEAGAVLLNLLDAGQVQAGFGRLAVAAQEHLPAGEPWQVVVMAQVAGGREVLLGARQDRAFGPVLAFGAGGIDTEVLEDVALRVAPVDLTQAQGLIRETRVGRVLSGIRGRPAADLEALGRALTALSQVLLQFPQIQEVDLNPVVVFPGQEGIVALDARIRVGP
jgi:acetyltransferase